MGRGRSKAGGGGGGSNVPQNAQAMTDQMAGQIRDLEDNMYSANTKAALKMYISNTDFDNQGHSLSQTMNFLIDHDVDLATADVDDVNKQFGLHLTAKDMVSMQYTQSRMDQAFHDIGKDVKLQRGAHDGLLRDTFGISDYTKMTESQLKAKLNGQKFRNKAPMSTSYDVNKNPFLGNSAAAGGREIVFDINAGSKTKMLFGAKAQSEVILGQTNWRITDVSFTGKTAYPRGGGAKPQLMISIETY